MRIDKFLKVSRLIKRREVAKSLCECEYITINGRIAKPSTEVKAKDRVTINNPKGRKIEIEVNMTPDHVKSNEAINLYDIVSEE